MLIVFLLMSISILSKDNVLIDTVLREYLILIIMSSMEIKCNLKQLLEKKNLTMYKLQKDTGVSNNALVKYRDNTIKQYDKLVLEKICNVLDCELYELLIADLK